MRTVYRYTLSASKSGNPDTYEFSAWCIQSENELSAWIRSLKKNGYVSFLLIDKWTGKKSAFCK